MAIGLKKILLQVSQQAVSVLLPRYIFQEFSQIHNWMNHNIEFKKSL